MIDTVIFDIGKVLADFSWDGYLEELGFDEKTRRVLISAVFRHQDWAEIDRGLLSNQEIIQRFIRNAGGYREEILKLAENLGHTVKLFDYTMDWLRSLKARGLRLYLLSNYGDLVYRTSRQELPFLSLVDGALFSWKCQLMKPAPAIYQKLLDTFQIDPSRAVFLDDRPENLDGASLFGIRTILFQEYHQASGELEAMLEASSLPIPR